MTSASPEPSSPAPASEKHQLLKLAVELGPLAVFFFANSRLGIFWGTGIFIVATLV